MNIEKEGEGKGEHAAVFEQDSKRNLPADEKVVAAASPAEEGAISSPSLRSSPNTNSYMITSLQSKDAATSSSQGGIESQRSSSILKSRTTSYNVLTRIGEGTFGEVFKATDAKTGQVVALKRIRIPNAQQQGVPLSLIREIKGLTQLEDPHVIHLFDHFPQGSSVILVLEYMHTDLGQVLARLADQGKSLSEAQIKTIMIMLLKGLAAVHKCNLMHRDLKPANLLLTQKGILKLADFGLVRVVKEKRRKGGGDYTHEVATRWYRAPELLFGSRNYGQGVDLWAVGCIFGELMNHMPLFPGQNDIDQLSVIFESSTSRTKRRSV